MSELKFACPVCGQHITCDSTKSGTQLGCPTCFQKLIVPNAPKGDVSKLILQAALVGSRQLPQNGDTLPTPTNRPLPTARFPVAIMLVLVCVAIAVFAFRGTLFNGSSRPAMGTNSTDKASPSDALLLNDTNWTLNLAGVTIPDRPVGGRIHGRVFHNPRVILKDGALTFRQGPVVPPDLALTIVLFTQDGWAMARRSINIETNRESAPPVLLRWKDAQQQIVKRYIREGYALRLDFGRALGDRMPGRIYFCAPDETKSYVIGTFEAEIFLPSPPKPPRLPDTHKRQR